MKRFLSLYNSIFLLLIVFIVAAAPYFVSAVSVGPAKLEYRADPGAVIQGTLFLINESRTEQTYFPAFEKFTEVGGERKFLPAEPTELAGWFHLPESVTLGAGEQKTVSFTVEVPVNAPPGGHFAVIWWSTVSPKAGQVAIVTRAGILVFLQVSGEINESGELLSFFTEGKNFFFTRLPEDFLVRFRNDGNTYLKPKGEIVAKNLFGLKRAEWGVNEAGAMLLPATETNLRLAKHFDEPPFAFAFYKAELNLQWGDKPESLKTSRWFFVFPWQHVLVTILILIVLFFGAKWGIKKYNRWIISKYIAQK